MAGAARGATSHWPERASKELALAHLQDGAFGGVPAHGERGVRDAQVPQLAIHAAAHGPRDADVQLLPRLGEQVRRVLAARPGAAQRQALGILSSCGPATSDDTVAPRTARAPVPNSTATTAMRIPRPMRTAPGPGGASRPPSAPEHGAEQDAPQRGSQDEGGPLHPHQPPLTGATRAVRRTARTATTAPATRPHGGLGRAAAPGASGSSRGADRPTGQRPAAMSVR